MAASDQVSDWSPDSVRRGRVTSVVEATLALHENFLSLR